MASIFEPLPKFKIEDLPEKKVPNWKLAGPGAVLVGLSIGAGEIIIWPRIAAEYGSGMIWAAVIGVFLQLWINFEIGRWTIATGETVYTGYARAWRGFVPVFIVLTLLAWIAPGWGMASGLALKALLLGPDYEATSAGLKFLESPSFWTTVTFAGVALVLFGPKLVYKSVERTIGVLVMLIVIALIVVAVKVGNAQTWASLGKGIVRVGHIDQQGQKRLSVDARYATELERGTVGAALRSAFKESGIELSQQAQSTVKETGSRWIIDDGKQRFVVINNAAGLDVHNPGMGIKALFIALVFAGAGGTANLFYTFYLRDKHIGMGGRLPNMQNPLRGRGEKIPATGYRYEDTDHNKRQFQSWWGYVKQDQIFFFFGLNTLTILLFIFGALAVLHPNGIVPAKGTLISDEAQVLAAVWGKTGRTIFLLVGVATLFSTQLVLLDGVARSLADMVYTNFKRAQQRDMGWWYALFAVVWILAGCGLTFGMEIGGNKPSDLGFLFNAAYMGGFAMAIYVPLTLYINLRYLPKSAKPGPVCVVMMIIVSCVYVGFAVACIVDEVIRWVGG